MGQPYTEQLQRLTTVQLTDHMEKFFLEMYKLFFTQRVVWVINTTEARNHHQGGLVHVGVPVREEHEPVLREWIRRVDHFIAARNPRNSRIYRCIGHRECAMDEPLTSGFVGSGDAPLSQFVYVRPIYMSTTATA